MSHRHAGQRARTGAAVGAAALVLCAGLLIARTTGCRSDAGRHGLDWREVAPGLSLATVGPPVGREQEAAAHLLRVDPGRYRLELWTTSEDSQQGPLTARQWCLSRDGMAAVNAGMYQGDGLTGVGLLRKRGHVNNPRLSRDRTVLLFDRRDETVPPVTLADLTCDDYVGLAGHYHAGVQGIRMLGCGRRNVWCPGGRRHSVTAIGTDDQGRVLLIHCGRAVDPHSLVDHLLELPIGLQRLMYLEGGPPAQLYVRAGGREWEFGQRAGPLGLPAPPIPNVIVIQPGKHGHGS